MVFKPNTSVKISLGKEPPKLGKIAGVLWVVCCYELAAHVTQASSGSMRVALKISSRAAVMFT